MNLVLFLLLLSLLVWIWQDSLRAREFAIKLCYKACNESGLQLLDQTVALKSFSLKRNSRGSVGIMRRYNFEFSINGADRYNGLIFINSDIVEHIQLEHPDGTLILHNNDFIKHH